MHVGHVESRADLMAVGGVWFVAVMCRGRQRGCGGLMIDLSCIAFELSWRDELHARTHGMMGHTSKQPHHNTPPNPGSNDITGSTSEEPPQSRPPKPKHQASSQGQGKAQAAGMWPTTHHQHVPSRALSNCFNSPTKRQWMLIYPPSGLCQV